MYDDGVDCSNCGFHSEKQEAFKHLEVVRRCKSQGWKLYPNDELLGEPIDEVIKQAEHRCRMWGLDV